jgi:hypothetical protein
MYKGTNQQYVIPFQLGISVIPMCNLPHCMSPYLGLSRLTCSLSCNTPVLDNESYEGMFLALGPVFSMVLLLKTSCRSREWVPAQHCAFLEIWIMLIKISSLRAYRSKFCGTLLSVVF